MSRLFLNGLPYMFIGMAFLMLFSILFEYYGAMKNPDQKRGLFQIKRRDGFVIALIVLWIFSMVFVALAVEMW